MFFMLIYLNEYNINLFKKGCVKKTNFVHKYLKIKIKSKYNVKNDECLFDE